MIVLSKYLISNVYIFRFSVENENQKYFLNYLLSSLMKTLFIIYEQKKSLKNTIINQKI